MGESIAIKDAPKIHYKHNPCHCIGEAPRVATDIRRVTCRQCQMKNIDLVKHPDRQPDVKAEKSLEEWFK